MCNALGRSCILQETATLSGGLLHNEEVQMIFVATGTRSITQGTRVEVVRGPLAGVRGVLVRKEARYRLVISVDLLSQGAAVEIDAADVVPA